MRIFVDKIVGNRCVLDGDAHRHVAYSLRSKVGDSVVLCPQDGFDYIGLIESIQKDKTVVVVLEKIRSAGEPNVKLTVMCAVPNKSEKLDLIVQKLTELGVYCIQPIITEYVQAKPQSVRLDRLSRICEEAAKQCGRGVIPCVKNPIGFKEALSVLDGFDLVVFPYEKEKNLSLKEYLRGRNNEVVKTAAVIIGSEGGFSDIEANSLADCGVRSVTLGNRILRTETANIAVVSALMYELDEWSQRDGGGAI